MLFLRQRAASPFAAWGVRGWPGLTGWTNQSDQPAEHPDAVLEAAGEVALLFWVLQEIPAAAAARDIDGLDDLLAEAEVWLDRFWRQPPPVRAGADAGDLVAMSAALWAELQRGRGAHDMAQVAVHAQLLGRLLTPATTLPRRAHQATPRYLPPCDRVRGGTLPLVTSNRPELAGCPPQEAALLALAAAIIGGRGHLSDAAVQRCPPGLRPDRTGWSGVFGVPRGPLLGSVDLSQRYRPLLYLRPQPTVNAIGTLFRTSVDELGAALLASWLTDSTLVLDRVPQRLCTVAGPVLADGHDEPLWRLPLLVFDPRQFRGDAADEPDPFRTPGGGGRIPAQHAAVDSA